MRQEPAISFTDLAESREFADFFRTMWDLTGLVIALVDPERREAKRLFSPEMMSPICQVMNATPEAREACTQNALRHTHHAVRTGRPEQYVCHAGMVDFVVPILVEGRHIATIEGGQIMVTPPTEDGFKELLSRTEPYGLDCKRLRSAYFESHAMAWQKVESVVRLVCLFAKYFSEFAWQIQRIKEDREHPAIARAREYISQHHHEDMILSEMASAVRLSSSYFSALFSKEVGMPFTRFVQKTRIDRAKKMLQDTGKNITEIAFRVGFNNITHFDYVFKKLEGVSPSEYRRSPRRPIP